MSVAVTFMMMILFIHRISCYTKVTTDFDLYGIKIATNERLSLTANNLRSTWYILGYLSNNVEYCALDYSQTSCDFVYSIIVPRSNSTLFVYNCININGNNVIGFFNGTNACNMQLSNEYTISNYSTQDNFIIAIDGDGTGVYGFADDFVFFYELQSPFQMTVWPNTFNISPRGFDIGSNMEYGVVVGYCQVTSSVANECGFVMILNTSLSCMIQKSAILIVDFFNFDWSDPRNNHLVTQSRVYSSQTILSVSIAWHTEQILVGIPSLNIGFLYAFGNTSQPIGYLDNGIGFSGFGKCVAWLDDQGNKVVVLADIYTYSTNQWISSAVYIYNLDANVPSNNIQPILIYPNSEQVIFPWMNSALIRILCRSAGDLAIFDNLGNGAIILSAPAGFYAYTNVENSTSTSVPCIRGTFRNYAGIELCTPCPSGTFSSNCQACSSNDSFCPYGSIQDLSYSAFGSIEQNQDYPESPENTVFDDLLMQNILSFNTQSTHCVLVSPIMWMLVVISIGIIIAIVMAISEFCYPNKHATHNRIKEVFKNIDLIGEGEVNRLFSKVGAILQLISEFGEPVTKGGNEKLNLFRV